MLTILTTSSSFLWGWFSDAKHVKVFTILFFKIFEPINTLCAPKWYNFFGCKIQVLNEMPCQSVGFHYSCTTNWREPLKFVLAFFPPSPLRIPKKLCWICTRLGGYKNQSLLMALIHEKALASFFSLSLSSSRPLKEGFLLGVIAIVHSDLGNGWILDGIWSHMKLDGI